MIGRSFKPLLCLLLLWLLAPPIAAEEYWQFKDPPPVLLRGVTHSVELQNVGRTPSTPKLELVGVELLEPPSEEVAPGRSVMLRVRLSEDTTEAWRISLPESDLELQGGSLPGLWSILPPILAIGIALLSKQVLLALVLGIFSGAVLLGGGPWSGFAMTLDTFLVDSLADRDHAFILLFTMSLGGMVALVSASGGMQGLVEKMSRFAKTPASTQVATWVMGLAIFFDDYANTLLVGQTMKPVTDKMKVSREKLAYLVDSTSAPIASIALVSTWIGYEMSLIAKSLEQVGLERNVYEIFVASILHRYYAIYTLIFVLVIAALHRDFGPMLKAERRALAGRVESASSSVEPESVEETTWGRSAWDAVLPVGLVLFGTLAGLAYTGYQELGQFPEAGGTIGRAAALVTAGDSFKALLWASVAGGLLSAALCRLRYRVQLEKIIEVYMKGVAHMGMACVVLVLAWAIGDVCEKLGTGPYLVELARGFLSPLLLPTITFILASVVAFATGTSWATMAIVMPLAVRLSAELPAAVEMAGETTETLLIGTIAAVLAGATFGDHCSPISDTTIMSSVASGCHQIDHVNTQVPYALTCAGLAIVLGTLPAAYGVNPWLLNLLGIIAIVAIIRFVGQPVDLGSREI